MRAKNISRDLYECTKEQTRMGRLRIHKKQHCIFWNARRSCQESHSLYPIHTTREIYGLCCVVWKRLGREERETQFGPYKEKNIYRERKKGTSLHYAWGLLLEDRKQTDGRRTDGSSHLNNAPFQIYLSVFSLSSAANNNKVVCSTTFQSYIIRPIDRLNLCAHTHMSMHACMHVNECTCMRLMGLVCRTTTTTTG